MYNKINKILQSFLIGFIASFIVILFYTLILETYKSNWIPLFISTILLTLIIFGVNKLQDKFKFLEFFGIFIIAIAIFIVPLFSYGINIDLGGSKTISQLEGKTFDSETKDKILAVNSPCFINKKHIFLDCSNKEKNNWVIEKLGENSYTVITEKNLNFSKWYLEPMKEENPTKTTLTGILTGVTFESREYLDLYKISFSGEDFYLSSTDPNFESLISKLREIQNQANSIAVRVEASCSPYNLEYNKPCSRFIIDLQPIGSFGN